MPVEYVKQNMIVCIPSLCNFFAYWVCLPEYMFVEYVYLYVFAEYMCYACGYIVWFGYLICRVSNCLINDLNVSKLFQMCLHSEAGGT